MRSIHGQIVKYVQPDGTTIYLHTPPNRSVINMTGWGYPPVTTHTIQGPFQHGQTVLGYRFQPRTISMEVIKKGCSRSEWFNERSRLISRLGLQSTNPNLPSLGRLQWEYVEDNTIKRRAVDCYLSRGLEFQPDPKWFEFGILAPLEFTADDPIVYDPTQVVLSTNTYTDSLILPITFPFTVGAGKYTFNTSYNGTWASSPIITVLGPTNGFKIVNETTGISIELDYFVNAGITITFDLSPTVRSVTDNLGNNLISYIKNSNLAEFELAGNLDNDLTVYVAENTAATTVTISYYDKYIGI